MILIMGAGNIGSLIGGLLARADHDVYLTGNLDHMKSIRQKGLKVTGLIDDLVFPKIFDEAKHQNLHPDIIFITTKAYDTEIVCHQLKPIVSSDSIIICLQNGIATEKIAKNIFPKNAVLRGLTSMGAFRPSPGVIHWIGKGETLIGFTDEGQKVLAQKIAQLFLPEDIKIKLESNIAEAVFTKTIVNCAINPVAAVHNVKNREIYQNPALRKIARELAQEGWDVAKKLNIKLTVSNPIDLTLKIAKNTGDNINSMLVDVHHQRKTEIDFLNGKIVQLGKEHGVTITKNLEYYGKIKVIEKSYINKKYNNFNTEVSP